MRLVPAVWDHKKVASHKITQLRNPKCFTSYKVVHFTTLPKLMSQTSVCDQGSKEIEKIQFWIHDWRVQSHKDCTNWKYGNIYIYKTLVRNHEKKHLEECLFLFQNIKANKLLRTNIQVVISIF